MSSLVTADGLSGLLLATVCLLLVIGRTAVTKSITFLDWSLLFIGLVFGASYPFVVQSILRDPGRFTGSQFVVEQGAGFGLHAVGGLLVVGGLIIGWTLAGQSRAHARRSPVRTLSGLDDPKVLRPVFWLMLAVAVVSQYLYSMDYGGVWGVFDYSLRLRSGMIGEGERSRFSFLSPMTRFALIASYGFFGLLLQKSSRSVMTVVGFAVSFLVSVFILMSLQGRLGLAAFLAVLLLAGILVKSPSRLTLLVVFSAAAGIGMFVLHQVSELLERGGASESVLAFYAREIAFVVTGFWAQVPVPENGFRYFYDIIVAPLFLLPSSWTVGRFENVVDVHTTRILGAPMGVGGVTGGIPVDIITLGYFQLGFIGILMYAALFGAVLRGLQAVSDSIELVGVRAAFSAYISLQIAGFALFYAHPEHVIRTNFALILTMLFVWFFRRVKPRPAGNLV